MSSASVPQANAFVVPDCGSNDAALGIRCISSHSRRTTQQRGSTNRTVVAPCTVHYSTRPDLYCKYTVRA